MISMFCYAIRVAAGTAHAGRRGSQAVESVTMATVIELVAAFVLPVIVVAAGHSDSVSRPS